MKRIFYIVFIFLVTYSKAFAIGRTYRHIVEPLPIVKSEQFPVEVIVECLFMVIILIGLGVLFVSLLSKAFSKFGSP